jgi:small subunit ribosomal protein S13
VARVSGVDLPRAKRIEVALTYIHGIGLTRSRAILEAVGISGDTRVKDLTEEETSRISSYIQRNFKVEGDLRRETTQNIKRLMDIGCYRGQRHKRGLPVRGQRTRTNSRTRKGPKKTIGARRK